MSASLNIDTDFADVIDGLESITLTSRAGEASEVTHALRSAQLTGEAIQSDGKVTRADLAWHLPVSGLPVQPELGATITDAGGTVWTILEVQHPTQTQRWQVRARNLAIAHGLDTLITIQQATITKDIHGGSQTEWSDWKPNVRAKIQPLVSRPTVRHITSAENATHIVFLVEELALEVNQRMIDGDKRLFRIERIQKAERLGEATEVYVREETWPQ